MPSPMRSCHTAIIPKRKQNSAPQVGYFRPISLLCVGCKIFGESSSEKTGIVTEAEDAEGSPVAVLQLDPRKACDHVKKPFFLALLYHRGVGDHLTDWVKVC